MRSRREIKMNSMARWLQAGIVSMVIVLGGRHMATAEVSSAESPIAAACLPSAHRDFDFWVGDWDVFEAGSQIAANSTKVARARVDLILDGCVLREDYQGEDGHKGQSFTIFDGSRKIWHQSWVTNRGELLLIEGRIDHGTMVLSGEDRAKGVLVRGAWKPEKGTVRETAATSTDGGKTWTPWFDLVFRPHKY
jgi:hypothetical protein